MRHHPCWQINAWAVLAAVLFVSGCGGGKEKEAPKDSKGGDSGKSSSTNSGSNTSGGKRIVVLMNNTSPFWVTLGAGVDAANKEFGTKATLDQNSGGPDGQLEKLRQYTTQKDIGAVAISVTEKDNPAIAAEMKKLRAQGVHVIAVDSDTDREKFGDSRLCFVGTDNPKGGEQLGLTAKGLLPDGGAYVCFVGLTGAHNAIERMDGFKKAAGEKFKELGRMADEVKDERAQDNVRQALLNYKDVNCLVGIWSYNAPAIAVVVKENPDNRKRCKVVAFDAEPGAIQAMQEGLIDAMVVQDPFDMGMKSVKLMKALIEKDEKTVKEMLPNLGKPGGDWIETGIKVVVPDNDDRLKPEAFDKAVTFLKLKDFKAWLAKYNLQGS